MATTYVIQNQNGHYWSKQKDWTDGHDRRQIFRVADKVDAINQVFELSSKDVGLRAQYLECETDDFGNPVVTASEIPLPVVKGDDSEDRDASAEGSTVESEATAENAENTDLETGTDNPNILSDLGNG